MEERMEERMEADSHDFRLRTVGSFGEELDAPQVVRRDDPRLELQAAAAGDIVPADGRQTCPQSKYIETYIKKIELVASVSLSDRQNTTINQVYSEAGFIHRNLLI